MRGLGLWDFNWGVRDWKCPYTPVGMDRECGSYETALGVDGAGMCVCVLYVKWNRDDWSYGTLAGQRKGLELVCICV